MALTWSNDRALANRLVQREVAERGRPLLSNGYVFANRDEVGRDESCIQCKKALEGVSRYFWSRCQFWCCTVSAGCRVDIYQKFFLTNFVSLAMHTDSVEAYRQNVFSGKAYLGEQLLESKRSLRKGIGSRGRWGIRFGAVLSRLKF